MEETYYIGLYINDEYGTYDYLKNCYSPQIDSFLSFYETIKIEDDKYKILDIIKQDTKQHNFQTGDILISSIGMITLQVSREDKIIFDGIESKYIINKKDFNGICEDSIDYLIKQLHIKLQNYKTIKINPYQEIEKSIKKYFT